MMVRIQPIVYVYELATNSPQPLNANKNFPSRRGHGSQLSISDPSHHVTEAIGTLYGDSDDDTSHEPRPESRPLSFVASPSGGEQISKMRLHQLQASEHSSLDAKRGPVLDNTPVSKAPTGANGNSESRKHAEARTRQPIQQNNPPFEGVNSPMQPASPLSPTSALRDGPTDHQSPSQFPLTNIDNPNDIAQELSNLQALRRMSMDVSNTADPDLVPFQGLSLMAIPSIAPTGEDDEGDISRLLWVPAKVHPELAPDQFRNFLEKRVQSFNRRSGESQFASDGQPQRSSADGLQRKKSMLSRQIDDRGLENDARSRGLENDARSGDHEQSLPEDRRLQRKAHRASTIDSTPGLNLSELTKDPNKAVQKLALDTQSQSESGTKKSNLDDDKPILPVATMGLRRSTRTTYRKGGSLRSGDRLPFSKRAAAARQVQKDDGGETDESVRLPSSEVDIPAGHRLQRVHSEPIAAENFSRPTRPAIRKQQLPTQDNTLTVTQTSNWGDGNSGDLISSPPIVAFSANKGHAAQEPATVASDSHTAQHSGPFPLRSSSQLVPHVSLTQAKPPPEDTTSNGQPGLDERQQQHQVPQQNLHHPPQQPPPRSSKRPLIGRPVQEASSVTVLSEVDSTPISASGSRTSTDTTQTPSTFPGTPAHAHTDGTALIPAHSADEKKLDKKTKDKEDNESSKSVGWKWFKSDDKEKRKKEKDDQTKQPRAKGAGERGHPEKGHDATRLDLLQSSIDNANIKGRDGIVLGRDSVDGKLYDEKKKESNRKVSDAKKEKDGFFGSIFGGSRRKESKDAGVTKSKQRAISPDPPILLLRPDIDYPYTRFPIVEERAIYRMAHIKLANPRRDLRSQVLLSNFMYSYLAKVQAMHPQLNVPTSPHQKRQEEERKRQEHELQQQQYLQQQILAQQEQEERQNQQHPKDSMDQYSFEYHRETTPYGDMRHRSDDGGGVDYIDDAQIFEYDHSDQRGDATKHQHHQDHVKGYDDTGQGQLTSGYYDYQHSENNQHNDNGMW